MGAGGRNCALGCCCPAGPRSGIFLLENYTLPTTISKTTQASFPLISLPPLVGSSLSISKCDASVPMRVGPRGTTQLYPVRLKPGHKVSATGKYGLLKSHPDGHGAGDGDNPNPKQLMRGTVIRGRTGYSEYERDPGPRVSGWLFRHVITPHKLDIPRFGILEIGRTPASCAPGVGTVWR